MTAKVIITLILTLFIPEIAWLLPIPSYIANVNAIAYLIFYVSKTILLTIACYVILFKYVMKDK